MPVLADGGLDLVALTRALVDIDSTTGREREALVAFLEALSPVAGVAEAPPAFDYATHAGAGR